MSEMYDRCGIVVAMLIFRLTQLILETLKITPARCIRIITTSYVPTWIIGPSPSLHGADPAAGRSPDRICGGYRYYQHC